MVQLTTVWTMISRDNDDCFCTVHSVDEADRYVQVEFTAQADKSIGGLQPAEGSTLYVGGNSAGSHQSGAGEGTACLSRWTDDDDWSVAAGSAVFTYVRFQRVLSGGVAFTSRGR